MIPIYGELRESDTTIVVGEFACSGSLIIANSSLIFRLSCSGFFFNTLRHYINTNIHFFGGRKLFCERRILKGGFDPIKMVGVSDF